MNIIEFGDKKIKPGSELVMCVCSRPMHCYAKAYICRIDDDDDDMYSVRTLFTVLSYIY